MSILISVLNGLIKTADDPSDSTFLQEAMSHYAYNKSQLNQDFFKTSIDDSAIEPYVPYILDALGIQEPYASRFQYTSLTVKEFLDELHELAPDNRALKLLLGQLDDQLNTNRKRFIVGGTIMAFIISIPLVSVTATSPFMTTMYAVLSSIPVFGLLWTLGVAGYSLYQISFDKKAHFEERFYENFLFLSNSAVKTLAYGLLLAGVLSASLAINILFVAAEVFLLAKELVAFWKVHQAQQKMENGPPFPPHARIRQELDYQREKYKLIFEIATAISFVVITAALSFLTGGLIIPVIGLAAIIAVFVLRHLAITETDKLMKDTLQYEFTMLESQREPEIESASADVSFAALVNEESFDRRYEDDKENTPLIPKQTPSFNKNKKFVSAVELVKSMPILNGESYTEIASQEDDLSQKFKS